MFDLVFTFDFDSEVGLDARLKQLQRGCQLGDSPNGQTTVQAGTTGTSIANTITTNATGMKFVCRVDQ